MIYEICFKVSWGDRWGAGAEVGSVEWWSFFGWAGVLFFLGVGLRGGGAPVVSIAIRPAAVHSMLLISIF